MNVRLRRYHKAEANGASSALQDDIVIVDVRGRLILGEDTRQLRDLIENLVSLKKKFFVLNLSEVNYLDSWGIGELIGCYKMIHDSGGELRLLNLEPRVRHLLTITRLLTILDAFDNEQSAFESFFWHAA